MKPAINSFTSYELTPEEELAGGTLSTLQLAVIQNELAFTMEQKLLLKVDGNNITYYIQQEADFAGRIAILTAIIDRSNSYTQLQFNEQGNKL